MPARTRTLEDRTRQRGEKKTSVILSQASINVAKLWTRKLAQYLSSGKEGPGKGIKSGRPASKSSHRDEMVRYHRGRPRQGAVP